jgi:polysaccharide export outer membrane protein
MILNFVRLDSINLNRRYPKLIIILFVSVLQSCSFYKQDIMFRTDSSTNAAAVEMAVAEAEKNYRIRVNDLIELNVYTNDGERLVDPNFEFTQQIGANASVMRQQVQNPAYLVQHDGFAKLPMVGMVKLQGLTRLQADSALQILYNQYYEDAFVTSKVTNRRVFVLGATGGTGAAGGAGGKVIPLENENMSVIEVLALSGGISSFSKAGNIRMIRGDLHNPQVQVINLSTMEGLRKAELAVLPNDIIYVEPGRRPLLDAVRDYSTFLNLVSSLTTLTILILTISR